MAGSPAAPSPPPPSNSDSSAVAFNSNDASGLSPGLAPAQQGASASPAAAAAPPVRIPSVTLLAVLGVVGELRARGFLRGLEIPEAERTDARASALFDRVLAAFLAEAWNPEAASYYPIPPLPLGDGSEVELLRVLLAVRAHGGFAAVASWAAVAEAVGLDPAAGASVKLLYRKYLELLDKTLAKPLQDHKVVESCGNAGRPRRSASAKDKFMPSPIKDLASAAGTAHQKRKRDPFVGMLNAVRLVAKSPAELGIDYDPRGHLSMAVWLRRHTFVAECLSDERLQGMLSWARLAAKNPGESGLVGTDDSDDHFSTAFMLRHEMLGKNNSSNGSASPQNGHSNEDALGSIDRCSASPIRPCGQADIPEWTAKPPSRYDDRHALRFLGEPILIPESNEALDVGSIGKGRLDNCNCQSPGSIDCIRLHVAEKKDELKRELGSAFYKMGLHETGEDAAHPRTKAEERKFDTIIQENLPSSKYNFWDKLRTTFCYKGSKGIASYYYNVFQVQRRAYQNHLGLKADSDDDSIEPGFLYSRQGGGGPSRSRPPASSRNQRSS